MSIVAVLPTTDQALPFVGNEGDHKAVDTQGSCVSLIAEIRETHRQRQDLLRAELRLNNQVKAIARRMAGNHVAGAAQYGAAADHPTSVGPSGTDTLVTSADADEGSEGHGGDDDLGTRALAELAAMPLIEGRTVIASHRKPLEKRLEKLSKQLDIWPWALACRGVSGLSLAQIVGETGDLSNYANPAKLWKRMGLAVMDDGKRQRLVAGAAAIDHGYNPSRRSIMWVVGDNLIRSKNPEFYTYYLAEKERLAAKWPDATKDHVHKAAHRHMEKRFLRELWRAWNNAPTVEGKD